MSKVYILFAFIFVLTSPITLVSGINYGLYLLFVIVTLLVFTANRVKFQIPPTYLRLSLFLLFVIAINAVVTPYKPSIPIVLLGTAITFLPFFHYIISFNFKFSNKDVNTLIDRMILGTKIVTTVCLLESLLNILDDSTGFIHSEIFAVGFVASFCNQSVALCLYRFKQTSEKKYLRCIGLFIIFIVLTIQLKAIAGCLLVLVGYYYYTHSHRGIYFRIGMIFLLLVTILSFIPALNNKVEDYIYIYTTEGASDSVARNALYMTSGRIAVDYFPFGTGQGTFASVASRFSPDKVMVDYGISNVYGLDESTQGAFLLDTHWANILGENGILGTLFYLALFFYPVNMMRKKKYSIIVPVELRFLTNLSILTIFIESFFLPLPNRLSFIFMYSGLMAILYRRQIYYNYTTNG